MIFAAAIVAVLYTLAFLAVGWWRPRYALAMAFALAPFQNDISFGGPLRFSIAEVNLLLCGLLVILRARGLRFGPTILPALAYLLVCIVSALVTPRGSAAASILQTVLYLVVAVTVFASLARSDEDYRAALNGFVITSTFIAIVVCVMRTGYVLGLHKNGTGATLAAGFLISLELFLQAARRAARWRYGAALFVIAAAEILTLSRGAWIASIAGALVIFLLRRQFRLMLYSSVVAGVAALLVWQLLSPEQKGYAFGMEKERYNIRLRLQSIDYATDQFKAHPWVGAGTGLRKEYDATNIVLLTLAETGVFGLFAFLMLHGVTAASVWFGHRRLDKRSLPFSIVALSGALVFGKLAHGLVDHYWSRGALSASWASVGMAAGVLHLKRRHRATKAPAAPRAVNHLVGLSLDLPASRHAPLPTSAR